MLLSHRFKYKLSIIVVNYNVEHFLDQCLDAVQKAIASIPAEVIIVDNNSVDGSVRMLRKKYPRFRLIPNSLKCASRDSNWPPSAPQSHY